MDKGVHAFLKGISSKMNIIAQLEFELAYFKATVQYFNHYTRETSPDHKGTVSTVNHLEVCVPDFTKVNKFLLSLSKLSIIYII